MKITATIITLNEERNIARSIESLRCADEILKTLDRYTTLAAQELAARRLHVPVHKMILDPAWTFLKTYFFQRGFLDGLEGLIIAYMAAFYTFLKYSKARIMS